MGFRSWATVVIFLSVDWFFLYKIMNISMKHVREIDKNYYGIFLYGILRPMSIWVCLNLLVLNIIGKTYVGEVMMSIYEDRTEAFCVSASILLIVSFINYYITRVIILRKEFWPSELKELLKKLAFFI